MLTPSLSGTTSRSYLGHRIPLALSPVVFHLSVSSMKLHSLGLLARVLGLKIAAPRYVRRVKQVDPSLLLPKDKR